MKYKGYKLVFSTAVHFGNGSLEDTDNKLYADTIFSALCHEALKAGNLPKLIELVQARNVKLSDAFPFIGDSYYIPKPMVVIESDKNIDDKKKAKKLEYIDVDKLDDYLAGRMELKEESEKISRLGEARIRVRAAVNDGKDAVPYSIGTYSFSDDAGLYLIVGYNDESDRKLIEGLLKALSYTGIGGKLSSGLGKFQLREAVVPDSLLKRITDMDSGASVMSLSIGMCRDDELESVLNDANYILAKRAGFISSATYAHTLVKKADSYLFKSGSVFRKPFTGVIHDVSIDGAHPVYRYANPIFMEVDNGH